MRKIMTLLLTAGMLWGTVTNAAAVDFNAKGEWLFGMGAVNTNYMPKVNGFNVNRGDTFSAMQRLRLQIDAVASESLSGTVMFEIGDTTWGHSESGGALGADGRIVELKRAYIDWIVPGMDLKVRMGLQGLILPNAAGGSAIFDDDVAAVVASYQFNETVGLTAAWVRPYNDNFLGGATGDGHTAPAGYLDNIDLFALIMPLTGQGWRVTPWAGVGIQGTNFVPAGVSAYAGTAGMNTVHFAGNRLGTTNDPRMFSDWHRDSNAYSTAFFAGLPIVITALDPWNFELDLNYGYAGSNGRYTSTNLQNGDLVRGTNTRQGWLAKGLVEYKLDWATPGVFGWYASGDDGDLSNGSERLPNMSPCNTFSSFMGDGERGWSIGSGGNMGYDQLLSFAGTWGLGVQLKDLSFIEDLRHTVRALYWGGTNSPQMSKYLHGFSAVGAGEGFYLTTNDHLVEFNLDSAWKVYDNLELVLELGYIINGIDKGTWERSYKNDRFDKADAYKAALVVNYSF